MNVRRLILLSWIALILMSPALVLAQDAGEAGARGPVTVSIFEQYVKKGGIITWCILIPLSVAMVALAIEHFVSIRRSAILPEPVVGEVTTHVENKRYQEAKAVASSDPSFFSYLMNAALNEAPNGFASMERAIEEASEECTTKLFRKIEFLNLIGNVAPMIGLFGTVSGMIIAFNDIRGAANIADAAADGIGTALITTFWGLLVAIPALTIYAVIRNKIDALAAEATLRADELLGTMKQQYKDSKGRRT